MNNIKALRIGVDGDVRQVALQSDGHMGHLHAMYREIDCRTVECIGLTEDLDLWVDEEGKLKSEWEVNLGATALLRRRGIPDLVAGNALLTGGADDEGNTLGISEGAAADVERFLGGGG